MPLFDNARRKMRINLEEIQEGWHPKKILIGTLTQEQLAAINALKLRHELPLITEEITFVGRHIYENRVLQNSYTIEDVLDQIYSGMQPSSTIVEEGWMVGLRNPTKRADRYGKQVNDTVIFKCSLKTLGQNCGV